MGLVQAEQFLPLIGVQPARHGRKIKLACTGSITKGFNKPEIIGENYLQPKEWLHEAKSVVSIFNPFTQQIKHSNVGGDYPSKEWLHGRIEGQAYVVAAALALAEYLKSMGGQVVVPAVDQRYEIYSTPKIYSNWSERHAAYVTGLGTFSINRGIITKKGMAGRFCSVITDVELKPDIRDYTGLYDNCIMCGACQRACPVDAINGYGKSHIPCNKFLEEVKAEHSPWYGCGKCQAGMPCESTIPLKNTKQDYSLIKNIDNGNE